MRLSDHFKNAVKQSQLNENQELIADVRNRIEQYNSIFIDGTDEKTLQIHADGSISYFGEIEFTKNSYVDNSRRLPFTFKKVNRLVLMDGYSDKLDSLEGLPSECHTLLIELSSHKPPEYFEGHFPKKAKVIDLSVHSLQNCKFGIEHVDEKIEFSISDGEDIKSLEGLPHEVPRLIFNGPPHVVRSFKGFPAFVRLLAFYGSNGKFDVKDLATYAKELHVILSTQMDLENNTPILSLFKLKGLSLLRNDNMLVGDCKEVFKIVNKYLDDMDVFGCQEELIDSGFEQFARAK